MASYRVEFEPAALRQLRKMTAQARAQIAPVIDALATNPRPSGVKKMSGVASLYRVRVGDFRIIYTVDDGALLVVIITVGNRREVYKKR